jgi:hypothetical protein
LTVERRDLAVYEAAAAIKLIQLRTKLKFEHLPAQLDTQCAQAAKRESTTRNS